MAAPPFSGTPMAPPWPRHGAAMPKPAPPTRWIGLPPSRPAGAALPAAAAAAEALNDLSGGPSAAAPAAPWQCHGNWKRDVKNLWDGVYN